MQGKAPLVILLLLNAAAYAQTIAVKKIELAGEKIRVHYDLEDNNPGSEYQVSLYSSIDNFTAALVRVTGDVGTEIKAGSSKQIEWKALEELGPYKGKMSLVIRAKVHMPIVKSINISSRDKYKRSKAHNITWKTSNNNPVNIELFRGSNRIAGEFNQVNNGKFLLSIPSHAKPGKNYSVRITDSRNPNESVTSRSFRVTRKVPLLLKIIPMVAAGALGVMLTGSNDTPSEKIPDPPLPDGN